jgi:hypothetical protein
MSADWSATLTRTHRARGEYYVMLLRLAAAVGTLFALATSPYMQSTAAEPAHDLQSAPKLCASMKRKKSRSDDLGVQSDETDETARTSKKAKILISKLATISSTKHTVHKKVAAVNDISREQAPLRCIVTGAIDGRDDVEYSRVIGKSASLNEVS